MEFPEEMIEELLIRLPLKSIIKFKCVSKDWNNLISRAKFRRWYQSRQHSTYPIGFVYHHKRPDQRSSIEVEPAKFVCTSNIDKREVFLSHDLQEFGEVIGSSKGLLLLASNDERYYVYDLLTRKHIQLPKTLQKYSFVITGFVCQEREKVCPNDIIDDSPYLTYKVVRIGYFQEKATTYHVETYSSATGKWQKSKMTTVFSEFFLSQLGATEVGGVLYWWNSRNIIYAYDPEDPLGRAKLIEIPISDSLEGLTISCTQEGCLICMFETRRGDIDMWVLGRKYERGSYLDEDLIDRSRWTLVHKISKMELTQSLLDFRPAGPTSYESVGIHTRDSSVIFLRMNNEFISYNLKEKRVETIMLKGEEEESISRVDAYTYFEWPSWPCLY